MLILTALATFWLLTVPFLPDYITLAMKNGITLVFTLALIGYLIVMINGGRKGNWG